MKTIAPDIPVARRGGSNASVSNGVHFDPQCIAAVALLSLFLPVVSRKHVITSLTSLFHRAPVAQVNKACEACGNQTDYKSVIAKIREWHLAHGAESQVGHVVNALEKTAERIETCSSLRQVVVAAKGIVASLGVAAPADASGDNFSQSSSLHLADQPGTNTDESASSAVDSFAQMLRAAEKVESEAIRLLDDEALRAANEAAVNEVTAGEEAGPADAEYFAQLLSHDVRTRENVERKKRGCGSATNFRAAGGAADTSGGARAAQAKARGEMLAIFVSRAQELIEKAESKASEDKFLGKNDSVRFITVHKSKGQEWPFVFVAGCDSNNFPVEGQAQCEAATSGPHLREERRIFFVAATRAKVQATFTYARRSRWAAASDSDDVYAGESPFLAEARECRRDAPDDVIVENVSGDVEAPTVVVASDRGRLVKRTREEDGGAQARCPE